MKSDSRWFLMVLFLGGVVSSLALSSAGAATPRRLINTRPHVQK
jgi:hypothetical protein